MITYVTPDAVDTKPCRPYGQSAMGYGRKIATGHIVLVKGKWRRVYATCYSNAASHWIMVKGEKLHVNL